MELMKIGDVRIDKPNNPFTKICFGEVDLIIKDKKVTEKILVTFEQDIFTPYDIEIDFDKCRFDDFPISIENQLSIIFNENYDCESHPNYYDLQTDLHKKVVFCLEQINKTY